MSDIKILVCENNHMVFQAIKGVLRNEPYTLYGVADGRQALETLKKESFDMVLTEILLPYFSGLELINMLRAKMHLKIPIVVLSMINTANTIDLAFQLGASDYVPKPFAPENLKYRIAKMLLKQTNSLNTFSHKNYNYNFQF
jgi:DNA-binding response OmpR family regulator